jgi:DNA-binding CsgD family transcriptional regulator
VAKAETQKEPDMSLDLVTPTIHPTPPKDIGATPAVNAPVFPSASPSALVAAALDSLGLALFVVDSLGRIVATSQGGRDCAASRAAVAAAAPALVRRARRDGHAVGQSIDADRGGQVWLVATPMELQGSESGPLYAIQAVDSQGPQQIDARLLSELCGLTPAEAQVVRLVADGLAPKLIATRLGVSLATVKTHLHRGFRKTGARGQADLVRRIARVAPQRKAP